MKIAIFIKHNLTGSNERDLPGELQEDLRHKDVAFVLSPDYGFLVFSYDATSEVITDLTDHPFKVRPANYSGAGVWVEDQVPNASANMSSALYDENGNGIIDLAEAIAGADVVGVRRYYGTNADEEVGFFPVGSNILYGTEDPPSATGILNGTLYFKHKE